MNSIYLFGIFASIVCFVAGAYAIIIADNFPSTTIGGFLFLAGIGCILSIRQSASLSDKQSITSLYPKGES